MNATEIEKYGYCLIKTTVLNDKVVREVKTYVRLKLDRASRDVEFIAVVGYHREITLVIRRITCEIGKVIGSLKDFLPA